MIGTSIKSKRRDATPRASRKGTIYLVVLMSSLIVATIGMATLQVLRLQGKAAADGNDLIEARLYARTAIEIGMLKIQNESDWRRRWATGLWIDRQTIENGSFSISVDDPIDHNVQIGNNHPILMTGIGMKGNATYRITVRLETGLPENSALGASLVSGGYTFVSSATLTSDQTICANENCYAWSGATVNADVEAPIIWGSTYSKAKNTTAPARDLPDPSTVLNHYIEQGTAIAITSIPQWTQPEMLINPSFETDTSGWSAFGSCTLQRSLTRARQGSASLLVRNRANSSAVAVQDLTSENLALLLNGHQFTLTIPVYCGNTCTARAQLKVTDSTGETQTFQGPSVNVSNNSWVNVEGDLTPTWTGTLVKATIGVSISTQNDYYIDGVSLIDTTYPRNDYVIDRKLISPAANPFGGLVNTQGIYVISCNGQDLVIADSRIVGTLVLLNPGANTAIQRSVSWEPAIVNYPALLTNGSVQVEFQTTGLSESSQNLNFNPPGTPYPYFGGASNVEASDAYPSKIAGIFYSAGDIAFSETPTMSGVVIANGVIVVNADSLTLQYGSSYLNNPPPGFDLGLTRVKPVPGTWTRTVE